MADQSQFRIVAQIASLDSDYDWYLIEPNSSPEKADGMKAILSSFRQLPDMQPLVALSATRDASQGLGWSITLGPLETPWRDRVFGRTIRVRLIVGCAQQDLAYNVFEWAVLKWWDQRDVVPVSDIETLKGSEQAQLKTIVQWLEQQVLSPMLEHESTPLIEESLVHGKGHSARNVTARFSESNRNELLARLRRRLMATSTKEANSFESLAAISEGLVPDYHRHTQLSLGVEKLYPAQWSGHDRFQDNQPFKSPVNRSRRNGPNEGPQEGSFNLINTVSHLTHDASMKLVRILVAITERSRRCFSMKRGPANRSNHTSEEKSNNPRWKS